MFKGKKLSILGDSVSTYRGVSNDANAHVTIRYNPFFYYDPFPLERTYWMRLIDELGMTLCVNNSWAGGNLSGIDNPDSGVNRVHNLANNAGEKPDYIIVFMGMNDLGRNVECDIFASDYAKTLMVIKEKYPDAKAFCINLPDRYEDFKQRTELFNKAISDAAIAAGQNFFVVDLFHSELNNDNYYNNTVDGIHPDEDGARIISKLVLNAFSFLRNNQIAQILDPNNEEDVALICNDKRIVCFEQIATIPYEDKIYTIMLPKGYMVGVEEDEAVLFEIDEFKGTMITINNPELAEIILNIYKSIINDEN